MARHDGTTGEKKRKRQDDGAPRPSKKAATAEQAGTVKVEVLEAGEAPGPILAAHPGLNYPSTITFKPYENHHTKELLLQSSAHPRLEYTAQEEKDGSADSLLKDYVGVYDPATGKLQLVEVKRVTLRSALRSEIDEMREQKAKAAAGGTMMARRHALASEFGSRKSKKAIEQMAQNAISQTGGKNDKIESAILGDMSKVTAAMPTKEDLAAAVDTSKPRPTPNLTAEHAADVYTVDTIVGKDLMSIIPVKDWVDAANEGIGVNMHSMFVANRMVRLAKAGDIQKLKLLRFVLIGINFLAALEGKNKTFAKRVPKADVLQDKMGQDVPRPVLNELRRKFATEKMELPRWNVDNLITHILAAALIIENFEIDTKELRDDLSLDATEIKQYFHELGCRLSKPTQGDLAKLKIAKSEANLHWIAKLRLPLQFPKISTGAPKGKRR